MKFHHETREVLAGAYPGFRPNTRMLSHCAVVDEGGALVSVLCNRVDVNSLADRHAGESVTAAPTCKSCASKLRRARALAQEPKE